MNTNPHSPARCARMCLVLLAGIAPLPGASAYPIDGYEHTGIGRLEAVRMVESGEMAGDRRPRGELLTTGEVSPRLLDRPDLEIPAADPEFTAELRALLADNVDRYSLAVLDLSDPEAPRYAEHRARELYNPGSVGKVLVATAWFQALADLYPDDTEARWRILRDTEITADDVIVSDHHTVRMWDPETRALTRRPLEVGDQGSLLEYLDWMMSASANAAASVLMKQGIPLLHFGRDYPPDPEAARHYLETSARSERETLLARFIQDPVTRSGLDLRELRQGSLFTSAGKRFVSGTTSHASARGLLEFLLHLEQGHIVDVFSSTEIKRLMYITERRIRYASSPVLRDSAVYFKSGSLYQCAPEPDFVCRKYHGNVRNLMNSVAIVESPAQERRLFYLVALMSNVLRKNSAVDHQTLATEIHRLIERHHAAGAAQSR